MLPLLSNGSHHRTSFYRMHAGHFVLERVSRLGLARGKLENISLKKRNYVWYYQSRFYILLGPQSFNEFVSLVRDKIKVEKYILCTSGRGKEFKTKWSTFHSVFKTL